MREPDDIAPLDDEEFAELRSFVERAAPHEIEWEPTSQELWNRIEAEVGPGPQGTIAPSHADDAASPRTTRHRWRAGVTALAVAAAATIAFVVVTVNDDDPGGRVLSAVDLAPVTGSGSGHAELVSIDDSLQLRLETEGLDPADGYFEVWLIDPSVTEMVSLGPLRADGVYDVPSSVDAAAFPIVDVSVEPVDGDPTHSGESVLRAQLTM